MIIICGVFVGVCGCLGSVELCCAVSSVWFAVKGRKKKSMIAADDCALWTIQGISLNLWMIKMHMQVFKISSNSLQGCCISHGCLMSNV